MSTMTTMASSTLPYRKRAASVIALFALLIACIPSGAVAVENTLPVCSAAVHDDYKVQGPDGQWYASWHPQIDHYSNCRFDHEHGSNPALIGPVTWPYGTSLVPAYGYVSGKANETEGHAGFKTYVFRLQGYAWMLTHHFGTSSPQVAACHRFHALDLVIVDDAGTVQANIHWMGDYGPATANQVQNNADLTPPACPTQAADARAAGSNGQREIPVGTTGTTYEPWRLDTRELTAIGLRSGALTINTPDAQKACDALACTTGVARSLLANEPNRGVFRFLTFNQPTQGTFRISGAVTGTFYTDPYGMATRSSTDSDAVKQYIKPGFSITQGITEDHCRPSTSTGSDGMYWCTTAKASEEINQLNRLVTGAN